METASVITAEHFSLVKGFVSRRLDNLKRFWCVGKGRRHECFETQIGITVLGCSWNLTGVELTTSQQSFVVIEMTGHFFF